MHASQVQKYSAFRPVHPQPRSWPDQTIQQTPIWCSVDLRDGNQALVDPMGIDQKLALFERLVAIGFKEIEVGFPSASQTEFDFCRRLIEEQLIPHDVSIQILCQARESLIKTSLEALSGASNIIFHLYNSTSPAQRNYTFGMGRDQIRDLAVQGVKWLKQYRDMAGGGRVTLEYSPESFSQTEADFSLEICEAVKAEWQPSAERPLIINLPSTVEVCTPNQYADLLEWFGQKISDRPSFILSLHTHNDRGTGIAASELGLLAGAQRIEGTLFGNGERTGNLDIVTMALNMNSQGLDTGLDFSDLPKIVEAYTNLTGMTVHPRHPYAGDLVFTAFSGSHQDAIKKALDHRNGKTAHDIWDIPYLPVDPHDIGRSYEAIIRINSQSGKGGVVYLLKDHYGINIPRAMQAELGNHINRLADREGTELSIQKIWDCFRAEYLEQKGLLELDSFNVHPSSDNSHISYQGKIKLNGQTQVIQGYGKGPLEAFVHALGQLGINDFSISEFHEDSLGSGVESEAAAWICLRRHDQDYWGLGTDRNIALAGLKALSCAINRAWIKN